MILHGSLFPEDVPAGEINLSSPQGDLLVNSVPSGDIALLPPLDSILIVLNNPLASFTYTYPSASFEKASTPIGQIVEVFFTPVLAIDDGTAFLVLDDGGRLIIN